MKVIKLVFNGENKEHYFGSYKAIYDKFSRDDIGCNIHNIWNYHHVHKTKGFKNSKVTIEECRVSSSTAQSKATKRMHLVKKK